MKLKLELKLLLRYQAFLQSFVGKFKGHTSKDQFLCLKNENIMERLLLQPEGIHLYTYLPTYLPIVEGIRNVVTIGIVYVHNRNNQRRI